MHLYNSVGPNPQVVRTFMAEKGIDCEKIEVDLRGGENRRAPYNTEVNPAGQLPALRLDNGDILTEVTAICEYLDETTGGGELIGRTPEERAETRMWVRRNDLGIIEPMAAGFRFSVGLKMFQDRMRCLPEAADGMKACAQDKLAWLEEQIGDRTWICGERFSLADIILGVWLNFGGNVGQPLNPEFTRLTAWLARVNERPSMKA